MNLAVVGSRSFTDYDFMKKILAFHKCSKIVSGGAQGADALAKKYAVENGIAYQEFLPNWNQLGKSAGFIRNKQIVDASDELVAFWDNKSPGTKHSIDIAETAGKPVYKYWPPQKDLLEGVGI